MSKSSLEAMLILAHLYLTQKKEDKAFLLLRALYEIFPQDIRIIKLYCYVLLQSNDYENALPLAEKLINLLQEELAFEESNPWNKACTLKLKGWALWGLGNIEESKKIFDSISLTAKSTQDIV